MDDQQRLDALRQIRHVLDDVFRVPGTRVRFGFDALIGLVPWAGDLLTALLGSAIIVEAHRRRVSRLVQLRMLINVTIDLVLGAVPLAGDVADVFWRSNARNMALLEQHLGSRRGATFADWLFVGGLVLSLFAVALLPLVAAYYAYQGLRAIL